MKKLFGIFALGAAVSFGFTSCSSAEAAAADPAKQVSVQAEFDYDKSGDSELRGAVFNLNNDVQFEDIILKVDFYNDGGSFISSRSFVIEEKIAPGESEQFKLKFKAPDGTESAQWSVAGAKVD